MTLPTDQRERLCAVIKTVEQQIPAVYASVIRSLDYDFPEAGHSPWYERGVPDKDCEKKIDALNFVADFSGNECAIVTCLIKVWNNLILIRKTKHYKGIFNSLAYINEAVNSFTSVEEWADDSYVEARHVAEQLVDITNMFVEYEKFQLCK